MVTEFLQVYQLENLEPAAALDRTWRQKTWKMEESRPSLSWFLLVRSAFRNSRPLRLMGKSRVRKKLPSVEADLVRENLNKLDIHNYTGPDRLQLYALLNAIVRPLLILLRRCMDV